MKRAVKAFCGLFVSSAMLLTPVATLAAENEKVDQACLAKFKNEKTKVLSERIGKKVGRAFESYSNDDIDDALERLLDLEPRADFDKAYVNRFLGYLFAGMDGKEDQAIKHLKISVGIGVLNHNEQTKAMRLLADLQMGQGQYAEAIKNYYAWMKESCTENADVYTRISQGYFELKQLDKMIGPADAAIALYSKPNQNPYILKLSSYYERKQYKNAVKVLETLVGLFPEDKRWWGQLGTFYMLNDQYEKALQTMELAYKQGYLEKASEIRALAQLYATNDIPVKSAQIQEKYIKSGLIEKTEQSLSTLANTFHAAREILKAAEYYGEAADISNNAEHYAKQGTLLLEAEQYDQAVAVLSKALDMGVKKPGRLHMSLTEAYFYQRQYRNAYAQVQKAKEFSRVKKTAESWESYIREKAKNNGVVI